MVLNIGALKSQGSGYRGPGHSVGGPGLHAREALCKVIIETAYLTDEEEDLGCSLAKASGAIL